MEEDQLSMTDVLRHLSVSALRFDGYKYEQSRFSGIGPGVGLSQLSHAVKTTGRMHAGEADNFGAFFILQRWLCKWGGEQLGFDSPDWQAFAKLFLHLLDKECPHEFVSREWAEQFEAQRHRDAVIAEAVREKVLKWRPLNVGLWNIDHPESQSGLPSHERRFDEVSEYLIKADCDVFIITEANAAINLPGYFREFSSESPFKSRSRFYGKPNSYHQVGIYSRRPMVCMSVDEPINGVLCKTSDAADPLTLYGNVITIKDQWSETSSKTYADRLDEQVRAIEQLQLERTLIAGDFNLRLGWHESAHRKVKEKLASIGWEWPTELRKDTVQHVLHSPDLEAELSLDHEVKSVRGMRRGLSDHPFIRVRVSSKSAKRAL